MSFPFGAEGVESGNVGSSRLGSIDVTTVGWEARSAREGRLDLVWRTLVLGLYFTTFL